tara:strand:+ start:1635 stop:2429 length:795 start_codon:yes stop_codon:yes gene_type:complete
MISKVKQSRFLYKIHLLSLFFVVPQAYANWLSTSLSYDPSQTTFWQKRAEHVNEIEDHLYRNLEFEVDCINDPEGNNLWSNYLRSGDSLTSLNQVISDNAMQQDWFQHEQDLYDDAQNLTHTLDALPDMELESYVVKPMSNELWQNLQIDSVYQHHGFMSGTASLHQAYEEIGTHHNALPQAILKIESKKGKLVNFLYQDNQAKILWRPHSAFRVIQKDYNPERNLYYVHLRETSHQDIQSMRRVVDVGDGQVLRQPASASNCR